MLEQHLCQQRQHMQPLPSPACKANTTTVSVVPVSASDTTRRSGLVQRRTCFQTALTAAAVFAVPWPAAANIVVPPPVSRRSVKKSLEEGARRREQLEAKRGPIRETPSGIQYREMEVGFGEEAHRGDECDIAYEVFTQGGLYLDSVGYGMESKRDVGDTVRVRLQRDAVPIAVLNAMRGMREGGKRRIVVSPNFGWTNRSLQPEPSSANAARRFWRYAEDNTPMLFEVDLVKVFKATAGS